MRTGFYARYALIGLLLTGCASKPEMPVGDLSAPASQPYSPAGGTNLPGKRPDGSVLLLDQWSRPPAGAQIDLRDFPVNLAVHPAGRFVAVLHSGCSASQISIVDLTLGKTVSHANVEQSFYGLQFTRDGTRLF